MPDQHSDRDLRFANVTPAADVVIQPSVNTPQAFPVASQLTRMQKLHRMHLFSGFSENPDNVTFQTQEPDERIILFLRKSQIINMPWIVFAIALLFIPPLLFLIRNVISLFLPPLPYLLITVPFYYLLVASYVFVNFVTWYYNAALVTNKRVLDIDFHQLVYKDIAETKLNLVQDVSYRQTGTLPNLFDFGHVLIQTAGTVDNFEFEALPKPERVVEVVESLIGKGRDSYAV